MSRLGDWIGIQCIMDSQKVDMFMMSNGSKFLEENAMLIRERLADADGSKWAVLSSLQFKSPTTSLILSLLLGGFGIDRFYVGNIGLGIGKLLTCGGLCVWTIIDWFLIMSATRKNNYAKLAAIL